MKGATKTRRILCIEDNEDMCELLKAVLQNFDVVCAATIGKATKAYESARWALLIVDEQLFGGPGLAWVKQLRIRDIDTAIVVMSGDPDITASDVRIAGGQILLRKNSRTFVEDLSSAVDRFALSEV
jgi:DNA-binding response OmpR family regulator